jgi:Protein of unknown function (DUF1488)
MPTTIVFPKVEPQWLFEREGVWFPCLVNGNPVKCLVTFELLSERFGAKSFDQHEALRAFREDRPEIEILVEAQIVLGHVPTGGEILLTPESLALKEVTYSEAVLHSGDIPYIKRATAYLSDILGRAAIHVSANWDRTLKDGRVFYTLDLHGLGFSTAAAFPQEGIDRPSQAYVRIAQLWGNILQQESHRRLRELAESRQAES